TNEPDRGETVTDRHARGGTRCRLRQQSPRVLDALAGLDVLARSPAGSGKTLAFALAIAIAERISHRDAGVRGLVLARRATSRRRSPRNSPPSHARSNFEYRLSTA